MPTVLAMIPWRRILPYAGAVLGALAIVLAIYNAGKRAERARLMPQLETARRSVEQLKAGIVQQNATVAAQGKAAAVVAKASDKAIRSGAERRGVVEAAAAAVEAVRPSGGLCGAVPGDVAALWGKV